MALTLGRMTEINRLSWEDVTLEQRHVVLYTRRKRGGSERQGKCRWRTSFTSCGHVRLKTRDKRNPWLFCHRDRIREKQETVVGPYLDRNRMMEVLCEKAGVRYFRFHAWRHFGASQLEQSGVPVGSIQRLLGHENRTTTELYLHSIGDSERRAIEVLDGNFSRDSHTNPAENERGHRPKSVTPQLNWCARQDSNLRPTDS